MSPVRAPASERQTQPAWPGNAVNSFENMITADAAEGPTTELLQSLIRNQCVNDGTPESGEEVRNADLLQTYLEGVGLGVERFDSLPGRTSIVARIEGSDAGAPALCLMGHTDVVPVNPDGWSRDPF